MSRPAIPGGYDTVFAFLSLNREQRYSNRVWKGVGNAKEINNDSTIARLSPRARVTDGPLAESDVPTYSPNESLSDFNVF